MTQFSRHSGRYSSAGMPTGFWLMAGAAVVLFGAIVYMHVLEQQMLHTDLVPAQPDPMARSSQLAYRM